MDRSNLIVGNGMGFMWLMLGAAPLCQPQGCILFYAPAYLYLKKIRKERLMVNALRMESPTPPTQPYFMGIDYAGGIDRSHVSHWNDSQRRQDARNYYDEQVRRYQELMVQQVALQPPQPIILTAQQNRRSDVSANNNVYDFNVIGRLYANNYGSNGQPPPKPEVKEIPKVEPIPPRKILSAISTLEIGE